MLPFFPLSFWYWIVPSKRRCTDPYFRKWTACPASSPNALGVFLAIFLVIVGPALYGYSNTKMYYDFSESLPQDLDYMIANTKLKDRFDISTTHMILADAKMEAKDAQAMIKEIDQVDGVSYALGFNSVVGSAVPEEILPSSITDLLKNDKYQLFLINSQYSVASDEVNGQITQINNILKKYGSIAWTTSGAVLVVAALSR